MVQGEPLILDASALIALISQEPGWKLIAAALESGRAVATPTALAETFDGGRRRQGKSRSEISTILTGLGLKIEPLVEEDAAEIAFILEKAEQVKIRLKTSRSLSLADAACLALGFRLAGTVIFSDTFWEALNIPGIRIAPFR